MQYYRRQLKDMRIYQLKSITGYENVRAPSEIASFCDKYYYLVTLPNVKHFKCAQKSLWKEPHPLDC